MVTPSAVPTGQGDVCLSLIHCSGKILSVAANGFPVGWGGRCSEKEQVSVCPDIQAHKSCENEVLHCGPGNLSLFILVAYSSGSRMSKSVLRLILQWFVLLTLTKAVYYGFISCG